MRDLLAHFATGVTVVAARHGPLLAGMTANAIASISIDPPVVMASIARKAETHTAVVGSHAFAVSVLAADQQELAECFAQPTTAAGFGIQVGAFRDKASADTVVKSLKTRGFPAYTVAPAANSGGLFTVRVGIYRDRADAESVQGRLNDDKFKPYIIKQ